MREFGLIGKSLKHSFSKSYFTNKFEHLGYSNCVYNNFEIASIKSFPDLIKENSNLVGLNVTIPYKKEIIPYMDKLDTVARQIGSVNTVRINTLDNTLEGFNTDYIGFKRSIAPFLEVQHTHALIFGSGGSSNAIYHALNQLGVKSFIVSRNPKGSNKIAYSDLDIQAISKYKLLVNTTPLGTYPNVEDCINIPYEGIGEKHLVYDLIYNPEKTEFLRKAKQNGSVIMNGLDMLKLQAEESWKIWNKD